jgi:hypothetical protein
LNNTHEHLNASVFHIWVCRGEKALAAIGISSPLKKRGQYSLSKFA